MEIIDFLKESNAIEGEFSDKALQDSITAWQYAITSKFPYECISIDLIRNIHERLMKRINPKIAGKLRRVQVGVMTKQGFKEAPHYSEVKSLLKELCYLVPSSEEDIKKWHIKFERIHPFEDGNGRVGRILMNLQRHKLKMPLLIIHTGEEQQEYYKWFKEGVVDSVKEVSNG
jgi:Fic family protein